jgi:hypothetical protein
VKTGSGGFGDLGGALENFRAAIAVGLYFGDHVPSMRTDVFDLDVHFLPKKHHSDKKSSYLGTDE